MQIAVGMDGFAHAVSARWVEEFGEALLDFQTLADAETWMACHA